MNLASQKWIYNFFGIQAIPPILGKIPKKCCFFWANPLTNHEKKRFAKIGQICHSKFTSNFSCVNLDPWSVIHVTKQQIIKLHHSKYQIHVYCIINQCKCDCYWALAHPNLTLKWHQRHQWHQWPASQQLTTPLGEFEMGNTPATVHRNYYKQCVYFPDYTRCISQSLTSDVWRHISLKTMFS